MKVWQPRFIVTAASPPPGRAGTRPRPCADAQTVHSRTTTRTDRSGDRGAGHDPRSRGTIGRAPSAAYYWVRKAAARPHSPRKATRALVSAKSPSDSVPTFVQLIRAGDATSVIEVRIGVR